MSTERRVELWERFVDWLNAAESTGQLQRVWLFGSFIGDKAGPGDLDILALFAEGFDAGALTAEQRPWITNSVASFTRSTCST